MEYELCYALQDSHDIKEYVIKDKDINDKYHVIIEAKHTPSNYSITIEGDWRLIDDETPEVILTSMICYGYRDNCSYMYTLNMIPKEIQKEWESHINFVVQRRLKN